ncbi:MAG: hypothetical protein KAT77_02155 [Nanoarchaeota archaeon]|nr:hypothetical protein [Nanoarchaeota archaeon]
MWKFTRKGQLEVFGLVIVVILISLGMLFLLKFVLFKPVGEERATFTRGKLAENTLGALMNTVTTCRAESKVTISDLIQYCAENQDCDGGDSCVFLKEVVEEILSKTLQVWNKDYEFRVGSGPDKVDIITPVVHEGCPLDKKTGFRYLRTRRRELLTIELDVCD